MKIAICDDEEVCVQDIISHINAYERKVNKTFDVDCYHNPTLLIEGLKKENYNLIYLDIQLNDENGIRVAEEIKKIKPNCMVIFVSSHTQYFHDSFQVSAFQYLIKPIQTDLFEAELLRAYKAFRAMNKTLIFPTTQGNLVLNFKDIVYIETSYREYKVYCADGFYYGSVKAYQKMKDILLKYHFFKIQRSFIINLDHIKAFNKDVVVMSNGDHLVVSRKQLKEFKEAFYNFMDN